MYHKNKTVKQNNSHDRIEESHLILFTAVNFCICLICFCLVCNTDSLLSFTLLLDFELSPCHISVFVYACTVDYSMRLFVFDCLHVCLHICVHPCMLVSTTENQWATLYNLRPEGSVKCGHGLKLMSAAAGMSACWRGATFGAEPCSQKTTEQRQTAGTTSQTVVPFQQSATVRHQHRRALVHL